MTMPLMGGLHRQELIQIKDDAHDDERCRCRWSSSVSTDGWRWIPGDPVARFAPDTGSQ